jgi:hypothetical protein
MFDSTFYNFATTFYGDVGARSSTIPTGLFTAIDTSNAEDFTSMFRSTFSGFGFNSNLVTIPDNLFENIHTPSGTNFAYMFDSTFDSFANGYDSYGSISAGE